MTLRERLQTDMIAAMRSGDSLRRDVAAHGRERRLQRREGEAAARSPRTRSSPSLTREVKTRRESVEAFRGGGREDLATKEEAEIAILQAYLPDALTEDELRALVDEAIAATGATSARDLGKVMGWLSPKTRGRADGKVTSGLVAQALAAADLAGHDTEH